MSWVSGYTLPLVKKPRQRSIPKESQWSKKEKILIQNEINYLLNIKAVSRCSSKQDQYISKIFIVSKSNGSSRLVINLKSLNKFVLTSHFKIEDHKLVQKLLTRNSYMATIDLKDAYYSSPVHKQHRINTCAFNSITPYLSLIAYHLA